MLAPMHPRCLTFQSRLPRWVLPLWLILLAPLAFSGCGEDPVAPTTTPEDVEEGVFSVDRVAADDVAFEVESYEAEEEGGPRQRRFLIRGDNIRYDSELGALLVDLSVLNNSESSYPEPVALTFLALLPPEVTILNADNGETGHGAQFDMQFANDDAFWTPGEESFPRTVQFGVDAGVSIGFVARVDVGLPPAGGVIGGRVWNDRNQNGMMDPDEKGIAGAGVLLTGAGIEDRRLRTHRSGGYRFGNLDPGMYTVTLLGRGDCKPTTPSSINVLLVEVDGVVSNFLAANFGCKRPMVDPPSLEPYDWVFAVGGYGIEPSRLITKQLDVWDGPLPYLGPAPPRGYIAGPVTDIDLERRRVAIMGTWIQFRPMVIDPPDSDQVRIGPMIGVQPDPGDPNDHQLWPPIDVEELEEIFELPSPNDIPEPLRLIALVRPGFGPADEPLLVGLRVWKWGHRPDLLYGEVQAVIPGSSNTRRGFVTLHTHGEITPDTIIRWHRDWPPLPRPN